MIWIGYDMRYGKDRHPEQRPAHLHIGGWTWQLPRWIRGLFRWKSWTRLP